MALPSSGQLTMQQILNEKQGSTTARTNVSLEGLSNSQADDYTGGTISINSASTSKPDENEPHAMSEFYGYDHSASSVVHDTTFTVGSTGGYGFVYSGYKPSSSLGSLGDDTFTLNSRAVTIEFLYGYATSTTANTGTVYLAISDDLGTTSPSNSGWTSIKFYFNQTNNSGSPDQTLTRSNASYTTQGNVNFAQATWTWSSLAGHMGGYFYPTWFGSSGTHFVEIV